MDALIIMTQKLLKLILNPLSFLIFIFILIFFIIIIFTQSDTNNSGSKNAHSKGPIGIGGYEYYAMAEEEVCDTYKVIQGGVTEASGLTLEEATAIVLWSEIRNFSDSKTASDGTAISTEESLLNFYMANAIAVRSFILKDATKAKGCTIGGRVAFHPGIKEDALDPDSFAMKAVNKTSGLVLGFDSSPVGTEFSTGYFIKSGGNGSEDYFFLYEGKDAYKILVGGDFHDEEFEQYLPYDFFDQVNEKPNYVNNNSNGHSRGLSQYGSYYLAVGLKYSWEDIIQYYYTEEIDILSLYPTSLSIDYNDVINNITTLAYGETINYTKNRDTSISELNEELSSFLLKQSPSSSITQLNQSIIAGIELAGVGTRNAVVFSAISMIELLMPYGVKIDYVLGGGHSASDRLVYGFSSGSGMDNIDCSGYVMWAMRTGGFTESENKNITSGGFQNLEGVVTKKLSNTSIAEIKPGDLIHYSGHIKMVVGIDLAKEVLYTAHAAGSGFGVQVNTHAMSKTQWDGKGTVSVLLMDGYYNNADKLYSINDLSQKMNLNGGVL